MASYGHGKAPKPQLAVLSLEMSFITGAKPPGELSEALREGL